MAYLGTSVLGILLSVFLKSGADTTVCDALDGTCRGINEPEGNPPGVLIYASTRGIEIFNSSTNTSASLMITDPIVNAVTMDSTYVYWSNSWFGNEGIYRAFRNGTGKETIAFRNIESIQEIAVDWITGNIYFIDRLYGRIGACTHTGSHCTLIETKVSTPTSFALHPASGVMYFTTFGGHIYKAQMDGKSQVRVLSVRSPTVLTIDYTASRLYWVNKETKTIESMKLDGTDLRAVLPFSGITATSMAVLGSRLFWNDWDMKNIYYCDKSTGQGNKTLLHGDFEVGEFYIHDSAPKPDLPNPCIDNLCEDICLLAANQSYTCSCNFDGILKADGKNCERIKEWNDGRHLIVAAGGILYDYNHGTLGKPQWKRINDFHHFADVFESRNRNLTSNESEILFNEFSRFFGVNGTLGGMALDDIGHNLYSTNPQHKRIEIMSLSTLQKTFIQFPDEPRSILLIPGQSTMIVTFCRDHGCYVNKTSMTGSGGETLSYYSGERVSLAYDAGKKRLLVTDGGIIERIPLDSKRGGREEMYVPKSAVNLAMLEGDILWTERNTNKIFWSATFTGRGMLQGKDGDIIRKRLAVYNRTVEAHHMDSFSVTIPTDVDVLHLIQPSRSFFNNHKCRDNNGGCSHVCLVESMKSHVCRCPSDMILNADQRTCNLVPVVSSRVQAHE